jgi:hypothetical protein
MLVRLPEARGIAMGPKTMGIPWDSPGHLRTRFIGGTYHIYGGPKFQGISTKYDLKNMVRLRTSILGSFLISIDPPSKKTINIHQHIWYSWQMLAVYSEIIPKLGYMKQATLKSNGQSP